MSARFHMPFEHGAWWSFFSTLVGALAVALLQSVDSVAAFALALSLGATFIAQDWAQAALAAVLRRPAQAVSQWQAPQGWALSALAVLTALVAVLRQAPEQRWAWAGLLSLMGLAAAAGLLVRVLQSGRGRKSLGVTALLLSAPALPLGCLSFGFTAKALIFWSWPLAFYPAATLSAQSYIRGFPEQARLAGPALMLVLSAVALGADAPLAALLLLALGLRLGVLIRRRWREQPEGLPAGSSIRAFGKEQAFFGVTLTLLWARSFA